MNLEGGERFFAELVGTNQQLVDNANRFSLQDVVAYIEARKNQDRGVTEAQANGARGELARFLLVKQPTLSVSESQNTAALLLGLSREFDLLPLAKLPELLGWKQQAEDRSSLVGQMMGVLQAEESPIPPPMVAQQLGLEPDMLEPIVARASNLLMQVSPASNAAAGAPPSEFSDAGVQVQMAYETDGRRFLWLLSASIPLLLYSATREAQGYAVILLLFFLAILRQNRQLVQDLLRMLTKY